jgi:hypothetical protein
MKKKKIDPLGLNWVTCTTCKDNLEKKKQIGKLNLELT